MSRYLVAVVAVAVAALIRYLLRGVLGDDAPFILFILSVVVAGWVGGLKPGLVATGTSLVVGLILFVDLGGGVLPVRPFDQVRAVLFVIFGVVMTWLTEATHAAYRHAVAHAAAERRSEERFRAIANYAYDWESWIGTDGKPMWVNPAVERLTGVSVDACLRMPDYPLPLVHPDDREQMRLHCARAMAGEPGNDVQFRVLRPDGTECWGAMSWQSIAAADGTPMGYRSSVRDITARKQAEQRQRLLAEAAVVLLTADDPTTMLRGVFDKIALHLGLDAFFNFMVDDSGTALRLVSCAGVTDDVADTMERLEFGQAVCGRVAMSQRSAYADHIQQSDEPEVQLVKSIGIRLYACHPLMVNDILLGTLSFGSRTRDEFDTAELEFLRTICHYVAVAYERLRLVRALREADQKKNEFLAILAHELRNPLSPIRNGLQVMKLVGFDAEVSEKSRLMMERQVERMTRLIDDLMDVARISQGKILLQKEKVLLADAVRDAVDTSHPLIEAQGHELIVDLPPERIFVDGDLARLSQVFANLLNNAAKYTDKGGHIRLAMQRHGSEVAVSVADNGVGIPVHLLTTVFDMFIQVDRSLEKAHGGLGIGLNIAKRLVERHGGTIIAESGGPGMGSTFTVRLPALPSASGDEPENPCDLVAIAESKVRRRILVVDDNRDGAASSVLLLKLMGNDAQTAYDGLEAIAVAESFRPEVILMDIGMPKLNGYDTCRRIREQPWGQNMVIVACTGWGQEEDKQQASDAGFDFHMTKPVDIASLEKMLDEFMTTNL